MPPPSRKSVRVATARLNANTPALLKAQKELLAKAILSIELAEAENRLNKLIRRANGEAASHQDEMEDKNELYPDGLRIYWLVEAFRYLHRSDRLDVQQAVGACDRTWRDPKKHIDADERAVDEAKRVEKELIRARKELRLIMRRKDNAAKCVKTLRAYLAEVRDRQQMEASSELHEL